MKMSARIAALGLGAILMAGFGCGSNGNKTTVAPPGAVDINGFTFNEIFTCNETFTGAAPVCADNQVADVIQFTSTGASTYEGRDVPDTGFIYTGTMSGLVLRWTAVSPNGYTESGSWTFAADGRNTPSRAIAKSSRAPARIAAASQPKVETTTVSATSRAPLTPTSAVAAASATRLTPLSSESGRA